MLGSCCLLSRSVFRHVQRAGTMAVLASHGQLVEGRILIETDLPGNWPGTAAMAGNALRENRTRKSAVLDFVARRKTPAMGLAVIGERRLKQEAITLHNEPDSIFAGAHGVLHLPRLPEQFFARFIESILALIQLPVFAQNFEVLTQVFVVDRRRRGQIRQRGIVARRHGTAHSGLTE